MTKRRVKKIQSNPDFLAERKVKIGGMMNRGGRREGESKPMFINVLSSLSVCMVQCPDRSSGWVFKTIERKPNWQKSFGI